MIIKEYKKNKIFSKNEILKILLKNNIFKDNEKKIIKMPNKLYMFKRNELDIELIKKYDLDKIYQKDILILEEENFNLGLNWLYFKEIDSYKNKNQTGNNKKELEHVLTTNKLSYEISVVSKNSFLYGNDLLLKQEIINIINKNNIELLEIPFNYKLNKLIIFFRKIDKFIESLNIKKIPEFKIRFKKIRKYKKEGMFINKDLIIVDPRNPDVFFHEFGHFIYENKINFSIKEKRYLSKNFEKIINKFECDLNQYSKLENYDLNSEKFAVWFEDKIKDLF